MVCCNLKHILEPAHSYEFKKTNKMNKSWQENVYKLTIFKWREVIPKEVHDNHILVRFLILTLKP